MIAIVFSSYILSLLIPLLYNVLKKNTGWLLALFASFLFLYFANYIRPVSNGEVFSFHYPWVPSIKVNLSFLVDGLSLLFSLLITGVGALVFAYSKSYMSEGKRTSRFYLYMLIFMGSMIGLVLSSNLISLFVFWELTSISSYMLIGLYHEREKARRAALQALLITAGGGLALLAGILILGQIGGTYEFTELLTKNDLIRSHQLYLTVLILVLAGAFTKSAQFPFHFWLPGAMEAPTPVSAYLHSATMVTAGVYLLARLSPVLGQTSQWHYIVTTFGAITMILGAVVAFRESDLKRILAYSTVSALGTLILLIGLDTTLSIKAAMVFLLVHSLYKGALFLVSGSISQETGTRSIKDLGGLYKSMPLTAAAALLAALSMAGLPPLLGFISKELIYEAKMQTPDAGILLTLSGVISNIIIVAVAGILSIQVFFGKIKKTSRSPGEVPFPMLLGPLILALAGLFIALFADTLAKPLISPAVSAVRAEQVVVKLSLWHGINLVLLLSIVTAAFGIIIYIFRERLKHFLNLIPIQLSADYIYDMGLKGLNFIARGQTRIIQNGYLSNYIQVVIFTALVLVGGSYFFKSWPEIVFSDFNIKFYELITALMILTGAAMTIFTTSRLTAIVGLGVVGYGITIIFILFGAPDLAITLFTIETLTVILFVLAIYRLPKFLYFSSKAIKLRDGILAILLGGLITILLLSVISLPVDTQLKEYFGQASMPLGKGLNVVNVILVDFRALDTLGETIVLAVAAIGIYALLKLRMEK